MWPLEMVYIATCYRCSHADFNCDELDENLRCPNCGLIPNGYRLDGDDYCWLHRCKLSEEYSMAENWLFITWSWTGAFELFPNARLYEASGVPAGTEYGYACPECQLIYENWLSTRHDNAT